MSTNKIPTKVFCVEDGGTHWVVARHEGEAANLIAGSMGMTRRAWYQEYEVEIRELAPHDRIRINLDVDAAQARAFVHDKPVVRGDLRIEAYHESYARDWFGRAPEIICSTEV